MSVFCEKLIAVINLIKQGKYTYILENKAGFLSYSSAVGKKEGQGPLAKCFDYIASNDLLNQKSWEKAESMFQKKAVEIALKKAQLKANDIDIIFSGDLNAQLHATSFGLADFNIPIIGVYGACSTMAVSLINSALFIESGSVKKAVAVTSSHFCSAERQFRFPLDYGSIRCPSTQWTVTGAGACVIDNKTAPYIKAFCIGRLVDYSQKDANNMGAAMAPAAADTISRFFSDTKLSPKDFDCIVTGDLGNVGSDILYELLQKNNIDIKDRHFDCGKMMFDVKKQDVHSGASGCGCSASILCGHFLPKLKQGEISNMLFCPTGALLSTMSTAQSETIPCICHAIQLTK